MSAASKYLRPDTGRTIEVFRSFDGRWMAGWRSEFGGWHRVKAHAMPPVATRGEAQARLDDYAAARGWEPMD